MSRFVALLCLFACLGFADTLTLKSGSTIHGTYLGGNSREVRMAVGDQVQTYQVGDISSIAFGSSGSWRQSDNSAAAPPPPPSAPPPPGPAAAATAPAPPQPPPPPAGAASTPPPPAADNPGILRPDPSYNSAPAPASATGPQLPAGTQLVIRMIDDVDSQRDHVGQTYRASIAEPVVLDGQTVVPRGADVVAKLVADQQSGKIEGHTVLTLDLQSLKVNGQSIPINTQAVSQGSGSRGSKSTKVIGGATALGAIIGAIAGGGRGAAIGGLSGAGAGTAVQVMTKGERVKIPSETRLTFTLQQPVQL
ncbi:MAG TPA: hypothetical protein VKV15_20475 [Bryobacteraceae bacterium]|nr:hypothetical protein [Bryobacteraceae bacterium]